jgi:predicted  nucleic acid-binding Zn-ribbon protein
VRCHNCGDDIETGASGCPTCGWDVDRDRPGPADEPEYREWDWADANGGAW